MGCCGDNRIDDSSKTPEDVQTDKYGKPREYDPSFNGPIKNRSCTDVLCCLLFTAVLVGTAGVSYVAFTQGDPTRLLHPTDSRGYLCGTKNYDSSGALVDKTSEPYVHFFDLLVCARLGPAVLVDGCPTPQVCVSGCPNETWFWMVTSAKEQIPGFNRQQTRGELKFCRDEVDPFTSSLTVKQLVEDNYCAGYTIKMAPLVGRCIPSIFTEILDSTAGLVQEYNGKNYTLTGDNNATVSGDSLDEGSKWLAALLKIKEFGEKIFQDLAATWWLMLILVGIAAVVSLLWIFLLRYVAGPMVWITIFAFVAVFAVGTYYCISEYFERKNEPGAQGWPSSMTTDFSYYLDMYNTWLVFSIISGSFLVIILLLVIFLRKRILVAIALIKVTSRAVGSMMFTLLWPLIPFALTLACWTYWGAQAAYLASLGSPVYKQNSTNSSQATDCSPNMTDTLDTCTFLKYADQYGTWLQVYNLFFLFWSVAFVAALDQLVLAGSFASYYWAFNKPTDIPAFPVTSALYRAIRFHLGSLAFGSLLIAIIKMIRAGLEYLDAKLKGSENPVGKFFLKCLKCCFWCLEKFIKFLNKNAYILIAVYGYNFCSAAREAFSLLMRNIVRVVVVDKITDFVLLIGKLVVTGAMVALSFFSFDRRIPYVDLYIPDLNFIAVPIVVVGAATFVITSAFFQVFEMGVDTMFLCFLEDLEKHDGSEEKPFYMSKELLDIVGKQNKIRAADD